MRRRARQDHGPPLTGTGLAGCGIQRPDFAPRSPARTALAPRLFRRAPRFVAIDFRRPARVTLGSGDRQFEHARNRALAKHRITEDLVVHVAALGDEPGVLDVADDLDLV